MARNSLFVVIAIMQVALSAGRLRAQTIAAPYAGAYGLSELGSIPGVPTSYGGLTLHYDNPNLLLIGGSANSSLGFVYSVGVIRAGGHIVGFSGSAQPYIEAAYNDGGVVYGPGNVLFLARWPVNQLGQALPGSTVTNKIIDMLPFNLESSLSALNFVPPGIPGAGKLKMVTYGGGQWADVVISPDGLGTYNVDTVTEVPGSRLTCGPEGFVYVPAGLPFFPNPAMLVAEYSCGNIVAYDIDADGNPVPASRRLFINSLFGAEGSFIDPVSGDFLFSTFGSFNHLVAVRGFSNVCSTCHGDLNADNFTNGGDIQQFVTCFLQPGAPQGLCRCGDMDNNGAVGDSDVPLFIDKIMGTSDPDLQCP